MVTLLDAELADLKAGKCYVAAVSRRSPLVAARGDVSWPDVRKTGYAVTARPANWLS